MTKVYGGGIGGTRRGVIAAASQKQAIQLLNDQGYNMSLHHFRNFWCQTGNDEEIAQAMSEPGKVFTQPMNGGAWS